MTMFSIHHDGPVHGQPLSVSPSIFPSLMNKTPRYLNCCTWGRTSPPTWRGQNTLFRARTMIWRCSFSWWLLCTRLHTDSGRAGGWWTGKTGQPCRSPTCTGCFVNLYIYFERIFLLCFHLEVVILKKSSVEKATLQCQLCGFLQ